MFEQVNICSAMKTGIFTFNNFILNVRQELNLVIFRCSIRTEWARRVMNGRQARQKYNIEEV